MKKIVCTIIALALIIPVIPAFADDTAHSFDAYQTGENSVVISGYSGGEFAINVFAPGKSFDDIDTADNALNTDVIVYHDICAANSDGSFEIKFNINGKSGEYTADIYSIADKVRLTCNTPLRFTNKDDFSAAVRLLNEAGLKGADETAQVISENIAALGFYTDEFNGVNDRAAAEMMSAEIKRKSLNEGDMTGVIRLFKQICLADRLNSRAISDVFTYSRYFTEDIPNMAKYLSDGAPYVINDTVKKAVTERMKGVGLASAGDLQKAAAAGLVLTAVQYPDGVDGVIDVMNDFKDYTGFNPSDYSKSAINKACGVYYDDIAALKAALEGGKKDTTGGNSPSGGSGGGGGMTSNGKINTPSGGTAAVPEPIPEDIYTDLDGAEWAKNAIISLTNKGVLNGREGLKFCPGESVTREEFAKMLTLAFEISDTSDSMAFTDVSDKEWYYGYVSGAYAAGIIKGFDDGTFGVGLNITRQDMSVMIYNALKYRNIELSPGAELEFSDADEISDYAKDAVSALFALGVINGKGGGVFDPFGNATRAEAAKIIYTAMNIR